MLVPDLKECIVSSVMAWTPLLCLAYIHNIKKKFSLNQLLESFI